MNALVSNRWWLVSVLLALMPTVATASATVVSATVPQVAPVIWQQVPDLFAAEALVEAEHQSTVAAQVAGRITAIHYRVGDRVPKGAVIMRIDPRVSQQELVGQKARVNETQVAVAALEKQYRRVKDLFDRHYASQAALDKAEAELNSAHAQWRSAEAAAGQASVSRSFTDVIAPYAGVMSALHVEVGETVAPGTPLATGFDPLWLRITARVPQSMLSAVRGGERAWVQVQQETTPTLVWWPVQKRVILPSADPRTHDTEVRVYLSPSNLSASEKMQQGMALMPGQFARVHFQTGTTRRLVVPRSAVFVRSELTAVYVRTKAGAAQLRQIRLGEGGDASMVEVLSGLMPGESVFLAPLSLRWPQELP